MKRNVLQGVRTVVRFNWHFFVIAGCVIVALAVFGTMWPLLYVAAALGCSAVLVSLVATAIAYDFSGLYALDWLDGLFGDGSEVANIHSGFDETSALIRERFPFTNLTVLDFYDPKKHTEVSIRRARMAQPPVPGAIGFDSESIPMESGFFDVVLLTLAAHEIRDHGERVAFFREIRRVLRPDGRVVVTEHLRDVPNALAYNIGALHFHSRSEWMATFSEAGFGLLEEQRRNLFITTFILHDCEAAS